MKCSDRPFVTSQPAGILMGSSGTGGGFFCFFFFGCCWGTQGFFLGFLVATSL
jgi:hypothetical protein